MPGPTSPRGRKRSTETLANIGSNERKKGGKQMVEALRGIWQALADTRMDPVTYGYCPRCTRWIRREPVWGCPHCGWSPDR